jgi:hypothetical protein
MDADLLFIDDRSADDDGDHKNSARAHARGYIRFVASVSQKAHHKEKCC